MSPTALRLRDVRKHFGTVRAVDGVSFEVPVGHCHGLIGANGAGKTTTFSLICGFLRPGEGEILVQGTPPGASGSLKGRAGVLPQDALLPAASKVGALLTYWGRLSGLAPKAADAEARRVLTRVGLLDVWGRAAGTLSHGMAKRVALAQAMLGAPPLLLLDEPTAGLDPRVAADIRQLIRELRGEHSILISSHNLSELQELCHSATILDRGRVVASGSMAELTGQGGEIRIQIARGDVPLDALRALPGIDAALTGTGLLRITFRESAGAPEDVIALVLPLLFSADVKILSVSPGHSLEERVLQVT